MAGLPVDWPTLGEDKVICMSDYVLGDLCVLPFLEEEKEKGGRERHMITCTNSITYRSCEFSSHLLVAVFFFFAWRSSRGEMLQRITCHFEGVMAINSRPIIIVNVHGSSQESAPRSNSADLINTCCSSISYCKVSGACALHVPDWFITAGLWCHHEIVTSTYNYHHVLFSWLKNTKTDTSASTKTITIGIY